MAIFYKFYYVPRLEEEKRRNMALCPERETEDASGAEKSPGESSTGIGSELHVQKKTCVKESNKENLPMDFNFATPSCSNEEAESNKENLPMDFNIAIPSSSIEEAVGMKLPQKVLAEMNWSSDFKKVTRKLLTSVFSRRVLATHSLSGKRSPAFPNKPEKRQLDPVLVDDIVRTVVKRCNAKEDAVRLCITTKCADECKMLRARERRRAGDAALVTD